MRLNFNELNWWPFFYCILPSSLKTLSISDAYYHILFITSQCQKIPFLEGIVHKPDQCLWSAKNHQVWWNPVAQALFAWNPKLRWCYTEVSTLLSPANTLGFINANLQHKPITHNQFTTETNELLVLKTRRFMAPMHSLSDRVLAIKNSKFLSSFKLQGVWKNKLHFIVACPCTTSKHLRQRNREVFGTMFRSTVVCPRWSQCTYLRQINEGFTEEQSWGNFCC
jgi:hypothetical protein